MRRLLHYLFPFCALFVALVGPSRAQAPTLGMQGPNLGTCLNGVCQMSEQDYRTLQAFARRLRAYAENAQRVDEEKEAMILHLRSRLDSCIEQRDGHKGGWHR